jgi:two-component system OmpR family sensor kinase
VPIRLRLAALFALATLALVAVGGIVFVHSLRHGLETSLDTALRARADPLVQRVRGASGGIDFEDPHRGSLLRAQDAVAQVLDPAGRVGDSSDAVGERSLVSPARRLRARSGPRFGTATVNHERYRTLAAPAHRRDGTWTVVVASSLSSVDTAVSRVETGLVVGGIVAVLLAGFGGWLLATAALRPVERMRRDAAEISEHDVASRLAVPQTRDEIAALARTMNELLARLQGALAREQAFVADAGHELRTPLATLRTELELAGNPNRTPDDLRDSIHHAASETDRVVRLAEELLFLARNDHHEGVLRHEPEPVVQLVTRSVELVAPRAAEARVAIEVHGDPNLAIPLDAEQFRRAIDNLLDNAIRFAPPGSAVSVDVRTEGPVLVVRVTDHGPGFPAEFLPHAFERFRRADDARSHADGGSGLGLAIVRSVADAHRGTVSAANRPGGGAEVTIRLPCPGDGNM